MAPLYLFARNSQFMTAVLSSLIFTVPNQARELSASDLLDNWAPSHRIYYNDSLTYTGLESWEWYTETGPYAQEKNIRSHTLTKVQPRPWRWAARWFPRYHLNRFNDPLHTDLEAVIKPFADSTQHEHLYGNQTTICSAPMNPHYSGYDSSFAFEPMGYRVSKLVHCKNFVSLRLVNYKSWFTHPNNQGPVRETCHKVLEMNSNLLTKIYIDRQTPMGAVGLPGNYNGAMIYPIRAFEHKDYRLIGVIWPGQDWSWAVSIGVEGEYRDREGGCPGREGKERDLWAFED